MIALDCGVKAIKQVAYAKTLGIELIICDHHTPGNVLPDALAVLDPKRSDCAYPFKELCGCGVGFKLIQGLLQQQGKEVNEIIAYLDFVVVAIAADIVPMVGETGPLHFWDFSNSTPIQGQALKRLCAISQRRKLFRMLFLVWPLESMLPGA